MKESWSSISWTINYQYVWPGYVISDAEHCMSIKIFIGVSSLVTSKSNVVGLPFVCCRVRDHVATVRIGSDEFGTHPLIYFD